MNQNEVIAHAFHENVPLKAQAGALHFRKEVDSTLVYSYARLIGKVEPTKGLLRLFAEGRSTVTTNRHIKMLSTYAAQMGYEIRLVKA